MPNLAAFLRGINVGGRNRVPMQELRRLFEDLGCAGVSTVIQSGNVVFSAPTAEGLDSRLSGAIEARFGFPVPVMIRSASELHEIANNNPWPDADPRRSSVCLLESLPAGTLQASRSPGDSFQLGRGVLYLNTPRGISKSKFSTSYIEKMLGTKITARNWNTFRKVLDRL